MPDDIKARIFDPFFYHALRGPRAGLSVRARASFAGMAARSEVQSTLGVGSRFTFCCLARRGKRYRPRFPPNATVRRGTQRDCAVGRRRESLTVCGAKFCAEGTSGKGGGGRDGRIEILKADPPILCGCPRRHASRDFGLRTPDELYRVRPISRRFSLRSFRPGDGDAGIQRTPYLRFIRKPYRTDDLSASCDSHRQARFRLTRCA